MSNELSFKVIIEIIKKRFWLIVILVAISAIVSAVFSGPQFIKPQFQSRTVVYPSNLASYGKESEMEQMLQLLYATDIRDSLIKKFDLYKRYGIAEEAASKKFLVNETFGERVGFSPTRYESVEIEVMDENPDTAKLMVDEILHQLNRKAQTLQRDKYKEVVAINFKEMELQRIRLDSMESRLQELRDKYGILDYNLQTEEATKGYLKLLANNASASKVKEAKSILDNLVKRGGEYKKLNRLADLTRDTYYTLKRQYEQALKEYTKELTYTNVVVKPEVADKKSYPVRWFIVFVTVLATLVTCLAVFIPIDRSKF